MRPIDANPVEDGEFTDAEANGSKLNIADLFHFSDWRDKKFVDFDADPVDYSKTLGCLHIINVKQVKVLIDKITTDMKVTISTTSCCLRCQQKLSSLKLNPSGADVTGTGVTVSFAAYKQANLLVRKQLTMLSKAAMGTNQV